MSAQDELTTTVLDAVKQLTQIEKARVLLNTVLSLIEDGRYGEEVEKYLDVYLKTPGLPKEDMMKALLARGDARKISAEGLLAKAQEDIQAVLHLDPLNMQARSQLRSSKIRYLHHNNIPACQRLPAEIWGEIAVHLPRYHLRPWLLVSHFHRNIASRHIFHTVNIHFGRESSYSSALGMLNHAKNDPVFASHVKVLRVHWIFQTKHMSNLMMHVFKSFLPAFKALRDLEWIGCPEGQAELIQALHNTPKHLDGVGLLLNDSLISDVSAFEKLRKFGLRFSSPVKQLRTVLDQHEFSLKHLILNESSDCPSKSLDSAFESVTIENLVHLELQTQVSHIMLTRIASAHNLQTLNLHKVRCIDLDSAAALFASDRIIDGSHTLLPHLAAFRFSLNGQAERTLYQSVIHFLQKREKLRRLDLGSCPWDIVKDILPDFRNLSVLAIDIGPLSSQVIEFLVKSIPRQMVAIKLSAPTFNRFDNEHGYERHFTRFNALSFLHFHTTIPKPKRKHNFSMYDMPEFLSTFATTLPSLDFLAWNGEPYVVVRTHADVGRIRTKFKPLPRYADISCDDTAWLEQTALFNLRWHDTSMCI